MTHEEEMRLTRELGDLQARFKGICDKSEENLKIGERIREIRKELNLEGKPRKNRRPPRCVNR